MATVVRILEEVFELETVHAYRLMMQVHLEGCAATVPLEGSVALTKVRRAIEIAAADDAPLKVELRPAPVEPSGGCATDGSSQALSWDPEALEADDMAAGRQDRIEATEVAMAEDSLAPNEPSIVCPTCGVLLARLDVRPDQHVPTPGILLEQSDVPVPNLGWFCSQACGEAFDRRHG